MKKNVSIFKKISIFSQFKKIIKKHKEELEKNFFLRIDNSYRLYTVINIPQEFIGEAFSMKKSDIDKISENFTREYTQEISTFLNEKGLTELYEIYEIKKVDKFSYLIVFGFSLFRSNKFYDTIYFRIIPISILIIIAIIIFAMFL